MGSNRLIVLPILVLSFFVGIASAAIADMPIYSDSLVNSWENWSWSAVDFASTSFVHTGTSSAQITYTGAWQGFFLHHNPFDTSLYTNLTFWIHGGGTNGRNIIVQALLNDASQPAVNLNSYVTGRAVSG